jgi:tetratricopeptide (TPR) repeat protein
VHAEGRLSPRLRAGLIAAVVVVCAALFGPFLAVPWEYDDKVEILLNRVIRHPGDLAEMVRYNPFRVLLLYTFSWDLWAWGIDHPAGFRALNVAIHAGNSVLLLLLLDRLGARTGPRPPASQALFVASGTLLFAAHPLAIESVTYVSGRSSSLATTWVLLSLWAWLRHLELADDPATGPWLSRNLRRANLAVGSILVAGLAAGVPAALLASSGRMTPTRAALVAAGIAGALLVGSGAVFADRWRRALGEPPADTSGRPGAARATRFYALAWLAFILGCLTKEIAATLPALLFIAEGTLLQRSWRGAFRALRGRLFPFFAIPAFLLALRFAAYGFIASPVYLRPWTTNLLTQVEVVGQYVRLWVAPYPQSIFHDYAEVVPPGTALTWLLAAAWLAVIVGAAALRRSAPTLAFGVLAVAVTLAPTSSVLALKETMVEHRTYLPSVGYAFCVAWLFGALLTPRIGARPTLAALVAALIGYATLHVSYDQLWRSEEVLWSHAVLVNPDAADAWRNLGDLFAAEGRFGDAERAYREAIRVEPDNVDALGNLGLVLGRAGRPEDAARELIRALEVQPCYTPALNNLAMLVARTGDAAAAVDLYDDSLRCAAENPMAHLGLGNLYYGPLRDRHKSAEHYTHFLELVDPHHRDVPRIKRRIMELTW